MFGARYLVALAPLLLAPGCAPAGKILELDYVWE
jgi:hypothetical protein